MGTLVRNPFCVLDRLENVVLSTLQSSNFVGSAKSTSLDLLFWLDGTSSGIRAVSVVKFRLIDCSGTIFPGVLLDGCLLQ